MPMTVHQTFYIHLYLQYKGLHWLQYFSHEYYLNEKDKHCKIQFLSSKTSILPSSVPVDKFLE